MDFPTLESHYECIKDMKKSGRTYNEISLSLKSQGVERGSSTRNVKAFCKKYEMTKEGWGMTSESQLEQAVVEAVQEVGPTYGRKTMTGYLKSKGVHACEERVGKALQAIQPQNHEARQHGARNLNPTPYRADYMGQKIHIDQNEKMVMYGVTHVVAIDGFSGKLVAHSTMPIKNNLTIYDEIYRKAVLDHGMWDQIRVDCGTEFYLTLFMQEKLASYRYNQSRPPFLQTPSTLNHRIERVWPEVNNRVNYPIKRCLMNLEDQEIINFGDNTVKFCVSTLACQVASIGLGRFVEAWNAHRVPGRGIPNQLAQAGCPNKMTETLLPSASVVADLYEAERRSSLTRMSSFGQNPFHTPEEQQHVELCFAQSFPDTTVIWDCIARGEPTVFQDALLCLIRLSS